MADAIGIATGIIEFIKVGKKVVDLCEKIKNVPQKILEQQQQLTETIQIFEGQAEAFQTNTAQNNNPIFLRDRKLINQIIKRCIQQLNGLERHLNGIAGQLDGRRSQRAWAAVCALRKDSELQDSFDHLQLDLNKLSSMFSQQSFVLLQNQSVTISSIESRQLQIHDKVESLEAAIMNLSAHTQIATTRLIDDAIGLDMSTMKLENVYNMTTQIALSRRSMTSNSVPEFPDFSALYLQDHIQFASECKCKSRPKRLFWSLGLLNFRDKRGHQPDCPLYGTSEREVKVALRLAIPFIFEKSIQVVFNANWGAGGVALSPAVKLTAITVDRSQSPAFMCMDRLRENLIKDTNPDFFSHTAQAIVIYCQSVLSQLQPLLRKRPLSVYEQDKDGSTILWEFLGHVAGFMWPDDRSSPGFTPTVTKYASRVIKMMVDDYGAEPNTVVPYGTSPSNTLVFFPPENEPKKTDYKNHSSMDLILMRTTYDIHVKRRSAEVAPIETILINHGFAPFKLSSKYFADKLFWHSPLYSLGHIYKLFNSPDLAQELGFPDHYLAIFRRSSSELLACTRKGVNWTNHEGLIDPMICALSWREGLRILLALGLDPIPALKIVRTNFYTESDAMRDFIEYRVPPFWEGPDLPHVRDTMLFDYCSPNVRSLVVGYVAGARKELAQIGLQTFPPGTWERQHLQDLQLKGSLVDEYALDVWKALEASKLINPSRLKYLWPGNKKSVYSYDLSSFGTSVVIYQSLFNLGFHDIDITEADGSTPFMNACSELRCLKAAWLISKGAHPNPRGLWIIMRRFNRRPFTYSSWVIDLSLSVGCDTCRCFCSTSGCVPVAVLVRKRWMGSVARRRIAETFTKTYPSSAQRASMREICRLEVFERLGMTHTCCRATDPDDKFCYQWKPLDHVDAAAIQEEEMELKVILDAYMTLFDDMLAHFSGRFAAFISAWWAGIDLFFPTQYREDSIIRDRSETSKSALWPDLTLFSTPRIRICGDGELFADDNISMAIIRHFTDVVGTIKRLFNEQGPPNFVESVQIRYLASLGISLTIIEWMQESGDESVSTGSRPRFGPYSGYTVWLKMRCGEKYWLLSDPDMLKKYYAEDYILPLVSAAVIRDVERKRWIPDALRERLDSEGVIVDGRLRPAASWREGDAGDISAEDTFERHLDLFDVDYHS